MHDRRAWTERELCEQWWEVNRLHGKFARMKVEADRELAREETRRQEDEWFRKLIALGPM